MFGTERRRKERLVRRGELFEALPEAEQPSDEERIALVDGKSLRLLCLKADFTGLSNEDANLLLTISSLELRFDALMEQQLLHFGRRLLPGDSVLVSVKEFNFPGVVRYKGELCCRPGTMFGVELPVSIACLMQVSYLLGAIHKTRKKD